MLRKSILFLMFMAMATYGAAFTFDSSVEGWTYDAGWGSGIVADPVWTNSLDHTGNGGGVTSNAVALLGDGTGGAPGCGTGWNRPFQGGGQLYIPPHASGVCAYRTGGTRPSERSRRDNRSFGNRPDA